jgi:hypothetical protein
MSLHSIRSLDEQYNPYISQDHHKGIERVAIPSYLVGNSWTLPQNLPQTLLRLPFDSHPKAYIYSNLYTNHNQLSVYTSHNPSCLYISAEDMC